MFGWRGGGAAAAAGATSAAATRPSSSKFSNVRRTMDRAFLQTGHRAAKHNPLRRVSAGQNITRESHIPAVARAAGAFPFLRALASHGARATGTAFGGRRGKAGSVVGAENGVCPRARGAPQREGTCTPRVRRDFLAVSCVPLFARGGGESTHGLRPVELLACRASSAELLFRASRGTREPYRLPEILATPHAYRVLTPAVATRTVKGARTRSRLLRGLPADCGSRPRRSTDRRVN